MKHLPGTGGERVTMRTLAYTFVPPLLVMLGVALARVLADKDPYQLTAEPTTLGGLPPYAGVLSTLGGLAWAAAVGMFLLGACLLHDQLKRKEAAFLAYSALFTAYLCLDDVFTLHESVLPSLGIPESGAYAIILALVIGYVVFFREEIRASAWIFLVLAVALLSASVAIDLIWEMLEPASGASIEILLEDGSKFFGICAWTAFAAMSTRGLVRRRLAPAAPSHVASSTR